MKYSKIVFFPFCMLLFLYGCSEFLEKPITNQHVVLDAPANNTAQTNYNINFHWEPLDNALTYQLQVVVPDFVNTQNYLLDTTISKNQYSFTLKPGIYSWRVRALNGSSETMYTSATFAIDSGSFANQSIILSSPSSGFYTNSTTIVFAWQQLFGSTSYSVQVDTIGFANNASAFSFSTTTPTYTFTAPKEGTYSWRVQGVSDSAKSQFSSVFTFIYDKTPPSPPQLLKPTNGVRVAPPDTLQWSPVTGATGYKVYVYMSDSISIFSTSFPAVTSSTSYVFSGGTQGQTLYWSASALDRAGNESAVAKKQSFVVGP